MVDKFLIIFYIMGILPWGIIFRKIGLTAQLIGLLVQAIGLIGVVYFN